MTVQDLIDEVEEKGLDPEDVEVHVGEFNHRFAESIDSDPLEDVQDVDMNPNGPKFDRNAGSYASSGRLLLVQYK